MAKCRTVRNISISDFYCINCGNKVMSLPRQNNRKKERFHRKKLWCLDCKIEINCVEVKNQYDEYEFKESFRNGEFESEAKESMDECRSASIW